MFLTGFMVRGDSELLKSLGFTSLTVATETNPGQTTTGNTYDSVAARVAEMEGILSKDSLDSYNLDKTTNMLLSAFAESSQDSYLHYYNEEQYKNYLVEAAKHFTGVGCLFGEANGECYVVDVFPGSQAEADGVKQGDFVKSIDGIEKDWTLTEVISSLDRPEGSKVSLTFRRPQSVDDKGGSNFSVTLSCSPQKVKNVSYSLDKEVGYIKIKQLTQNCDEYVKQAIEDLNSQGAEAFVLDIRDNPGGYLTQAVNISSFFIKSGVIVQLETVDGESIKNATGDVLTDKPLVVLIDKNTAAASEVMAAALKDNKRATLVGEPSLGKGTVQVVRPFTFGGALRYTAARYISPLGHEINEVGVTPPNQVGQSSDSDSQKLVAVNTARSMIEK